MMSIINISLISDEDEFDEHSNNVLPDADVYYCNNHLDIITGEDFGIKLDKETFIIW